MNDGLRGLQTMAQVNEKPHAPQKGLPPVLVKQERKAAQEAIEEAFRQGVWRRDGGKSRASGRKLARSAKGWDQRGEVHHALKRSTHPAGKWNVDRGILLSLTEHALAEAICPHAPAHYMLEIVGPEDLGLPQTFIWRDIHGNETKRRLG